MFWILIATGVLYLLGVLFFLWVNMQMPMTGGLILLRSFLWPLTLFGLLEGEQEPMD